ncbi:CDP-diacylglycerol--serine O-phosphatidyltransferase [candidate division TA06 bacterium]|uniref:CDP-diacylglycerol--serine O-phosphatidyltransferase n=1 Tax=candidate division TA06 bacterium TaxID=2250710 RepID=A0A933IAC0_UNCT6|nr:CDP-diacylglycerol--serine O-phosphatidyltransferase [candidate division TA06 bacterium]
MEAFKGNSYRGAWLIILAAFFDSTDGMVARLTRQSSRFGVELDSLSDMVSFVLAPVMLIYPLCLMELNLGGILAGFAFVVSGAIRLARFNVEQKNLLEKGGFIGLPTPAAAAAIAGFLIFSNYLQGSLLFPRLVPFFLVLLALLMVSPVEYPPFPKLAAKSLRSYFIYSLLVLAMIGLVIRPQLVIFPVLFLYIIFGLVRRLVVKIASKRGKGTIPSH